jgi:NhaA family Na+:H+ antiporter
MTEPPDVTPRRGRRGASFARVVVQPIQRFTVVESAAGVALAVATAIALVWANSGFSDAYRTLWLHELTASVGSSSVTIDLRHIVDDGLMAIFFFVIGLEIKREWCFGELRDRRAARLPIVAALGGMVVPALLYTVFAGSTAAGHGWGIPMATDIAFVVGVVALLGRRVPSPIKVFLLTLAIVDDLGAIAVIAVFYAGTIDARWLGLAVGGLGVVVALRALGVARYLPYVAVGTVVWFATWQSGVHATMAGVALALLTPVRPVGPAPDRASDAAVPDEDVPDEDVPDAGVPEGVGSPLAYLEDLLHPWASFVVVPLFALANAGVRLTTDLPDAGLRVTAGVVVGLVVGKLAGVVGASWVAVRLRIAVLPGGVRWAHLAGAGALAGIGFTMSLFVTELAFVRTPHGRELVGAAKQAILVASIIAAVLGSLVFVVSGRTARARAGRP